MRMSVWKRSPTGFALLVCMGLYFFHFYSIWKYAVDVPYYDDWATFESAQLPSGLSLAGLTMQNNEHRMATTRLLIWSLYRVNGWNIAIHQTINFVLYGLTLLTMVWVLMRATSEHVGFAVLCFMIFLFSPINRVNHFWASQSLLHFWLLFLVIACYFLFRELENWRDVIFAAVAAILCMYSMAAGVVSTMVLLAMFTLFKISKVHKEKFFAYRNSLMRAISIWAILITAILFWLSDYSKPSYHPALVLPYRWEFWSHFLNIVALGFGIDQLSNILGAFYLLVVLLPMVGVVYRYGPNLPIGSWRSITLTLTVLAVLASVSVGRAALSIEQSKESRYFELAMPLLPLSVVNWTVFLQETTYWRRAVLVTLWIICCFAFGDNWRQFRYYKREAVKRHTAHACLQAYYQGKGDGNCPTVYPVSIPPRLLEEGKKLNVSFYRRISSQGRRQ